MIDRRAQWVRFYEAALTGACADPHISDGDGVARFAAGVADAAMERLDARTFPPSKVEALVNVARNMVKADDPTEIHFAQQALDKALADMKEQS